MLGSSRDKYLVATRSAIALVLTARFDWSPQECGEYLGKSRNNILYYLKILRGANLDPRASGDATDPSDNQSDSDVEEI